MSRVLLKNVTHYATEELVDCLIVDGVIHSCAPQLSDQADQVYTFTGEYLIPGVIDAHVHFRVPGGEQKEDFVTGSQAALAGGVTTVIDMPNTEPPIVTIDQLNKKLTQAQSEGLVNIQCYIGATTDNLDQLEKASHIAKGIKVAPYFTGSDGSVLIHNDEAMTRLFSLSLACPIVIHCEDDADIQAREQSFLDYTKKDIHENIRTSDGAVRTMKRILGLLRGHETAVHFTHITLKSEVELIREAKNQGLNVSCDVTPHHLTFTEKDAKKKAFWLKVNPPLRTREDQVALWAALIDGTIDMVASDHAPHTTEEKSSSDYWSVPSGVPGVQENLLVLLNSVQPDFPMKRLVEVTSQFPAQRFGFDHHGHIESGAPGDVVVVNTTTSWKLKRADIVSKCGWSAYEGQNFFSRIEAVFRSGRLLGGRLNEKLK